MRVISNNVGNLFNSYISSFHSLEYISILIVKSNQQSFISAIKYANNIKKNKELRKIYMVLTLLDHKSNYMPNGGTCELYLMLNLRTLKYLCVTIL